MRYPDGLWLNEVLENRKVRRMLLLKEEVMRNFS